MSTFGRQVVLVPVDYSDESRRALAVGCEAVASSGVLHVTHVTPSPPIGVIPPGTSEEARARQGMAELQAYLSQAGITGCLKIHILEGDPGHEIVKLADSIKADLIVMPSHGRAGIAHVLIGSVAERVVRLAHCPVLVLRK